MKKRKLSTVKLFFLFATLGAFPFLYPAMQFQNQTMGQGYERSFEINMANRLVPKPANPSLSNELLETRKAVLKELSPIDPVLGSEVQPDPVD